MTTNIKSYQDFINEDIKELTQDSTYALTKTKRIVKGENPFIDTENGNIIAMDLCLNKEELDKVIELWKEGNKEGAANILKNYGIRERNKQFNLAFGLMMSGLCLGTGACISKLVKVVNTETIEHVDVIKDHLPPVKVHNALLKFYQELGDNLKITDGKEFIKASASKEKLVEIFDRLADAKDISRDEFMKKMFSITHDGNQELMNAEISYFNKCLEDDNIKTVGQIFKNTEAGDMTGIKGFNPFGIKSPEAAEKLAKFFNDTEITKGINKWTEVITTELTKEVPGSDVAKAATAGSVAVEPTVGAVRDKEDKKESKIHNFQSFVKVR